MEEKMDRKCENCKFFEDINKWGHCRRYAPRHISGVGTGYEEKMWPEVKSYDWCGEFQEKEPCPKAA